MGLSTLDLAPGGTDQTWRWYFTTGGGSLATGLTMCTGDGIDTALFLNEDGFGPVSPDGMPSVFRSKATAARTIDLPDHSGEIEIPVMAVLAADASSTVTAFAAVPNWGVLLQANTLYEVDIILALKSAATATGVYARLMGPTGAGQVDYLNVVFDYVGITEQPFIAFGVEAGWTSSLYANAPFRGRITGIIKTGMTAPTVPVTLDLRSDVAGSQVAVLKGSAMRFRPLVPTP